MPSFSIRKSSAPSPALLSSGLFMTRRWKSRIFSRAIAADIVKSAFLKEAFITRDTVSFATMHDNTLLDPARNKEKSFSLFPLYL
jgi:hypothetical protein